MKLTLLILLICVPFLAMAQNDDPIKNTEQHYLSSEINLVTGPVWRTTHAIDKKINTTLVQDMPYDQFALNFDTPKIYNLSIRKQQNKSVKLIDNLQSDRDLDELKPIHFFYGRFKTSN